MLNNDFPKLIEKYQRYQRKKRMRRLSRLSVLVLIVAAGWFGYQNRALLIPEKTAPVKPVMQNSTAAKAVSVQKPASEPLPKKELKRVAVPTPKAKPMPNRVYPRKSKNLKESEARALKFKITKKENLFELIKKDKKEQTYSSAIALAHYFLEQEEYKEAIKWAIRASKKNPRKSEPWIIYAKAKAATGKTEIAKKALRIYLQRHNSKEVRNLLESL
ncbi:MAG: hypothetical protein B6D59_01175 [Campylobacteraceae bacterium 4484_4]|nr:MAG: hypothetical protein B6D59_01175 [Campylobacteraceae bacterium 4484_4]